MNAKLRLATKGRDAGNRSSKKTKKPASLQAFVLLVGRAGIEPTTNGLRGEENKRFIYFNHALATIATFSKPI